MLFHFLAQKHNILEPILSINNLTKKYGNLTAVKNLSFTINKGNVYGILGPNGSGKSTTLGIALNVVNKLVEILGGLTEPFLLTKL